MAERVVIDPRFHGFPRMAHGGYVSGVLAGLIGESARITLRASPPLGRPLRVARDNRATVRLLDGATVLAKAEPGSVDVVAPAPPSFDEATKAARVFPGFDRTPSPTCFCCGHQREEGDGLRIFPSPIRDREIVAAPWVPGPSFAGEDGPVRPEVVWAALDCPGAWALRLRYPEGNRRLTVRMAARQLRSVEVGQHHVVVGWPLSRRRRMLQCGSAVFGPDGDLRALGWATWMELAGTTPDVQAG